MGFLISSELRKIGTSIYIFGALGVISRAFGIDIAKIPGLELSVTGTPSIDMAGIVGLAVIFLTLSFGAKALQEYASYKIARRREEMQLLGTTEVLELAGSIPTDPHREAFGVEVQREETRYRSILRIATRLTGFVDVLFPLFFGLISGVILAEPAWSFVAALGHKIWWRLS